VTCRYNLPKRAQRSRIEDVLFPALASVIARHASLCCTIVNEATEDPLFVRLESIILKDIVTFISLHDEDSLRQHLEQLHDQSWTHLEQRLPWKLVVFQHPTTEDNVIDIAFVFHHAIVDGLSAAAFHNSLLQAFQAFTSEQNEVTKIFEVVQTSQNLKLLAAVEDLVQLPISWGFLAGQVLREFGPGLLYRSQGTLWSGASCAPLEKLPYSPRIRIVAIPAPKVDAMLKAARAKKATVTSLVTGILVVALVDLIPEAERFLGATPYSMRGWTGTSDDEIVNQVSVLDTVYDQALLDTVRASPMDSTARVWEVAHRFQNDLRAELHRCPKDVSVGLLPYISNYREMFLKKINRPREATFEVSNLGLFNPDKKEDELGSEVSPCSIESMLFTQGPNVVGPAINVNCATVRGGPLNISITWQDGVVDESIIDGIVRAFEHIVL